MTKGTNLFKMGVTTDRNMFNKNKTIERSSKREVFTNK